MKGSTMMARISAGREHADAVGRALEEQADAGHLAERVHQEGLHVLLQERREEEQAPDAVDDRRDAGQQLDGDGDGTPDDLGAELGEEDRDAEADAARR